MRFAVLFLLFVGVQWSCEKDREEAISGTYLWAPFISVSLENQGATLYMSDPRPYTDYAGPPPVSPDYFEVLISEGPGDFTVQTRLERFTDRLDIQDLDNGKEYFFKVLGHRRGFETVTSNLVMTIPAVGPTIEAYPLDTDYSVESMALSRNQRFLTFFSFDFQNGLWSQDLLLLDRESREVESLGNYSNSPHWNDVTDDLVYMSAITEGNTTYNNGILLRSEGNGETTELLAINYNDHWVSTPRFVPGNQAISYFSSKENGETYHYDLWSLDRSTGEETRLSGFEEMGFQVDNLGYDWSASGENVWLSGRLGEEVYENDIFQFEWETRSLTPVIESPWDDRTPVLSPDGTQVAFVSSRSGYFRGDVWLYDRTSGEYRRLTGRGTEALFYDNSSNLTWLDNDRLLVNLLAQNGHSDAYILRIR